MSEQFAWLAEASLHARNISSVQLRDLIDNPNLFPFRINPISAENLVAASPRLHLIRHGFDDRFVMLRNSGGGGLPTPRQSCEMMIGHKKKTTVLGIVRSG